ncbi:MAG: 50S ribosomal protein L4 [Phycisphaeraceae bacterium]|nr:MAG: 50S ribosomal protein L4 [Phycisphaeraceae bacterium]
MDVPVYDMQGKQTGTMPVDEVALGERVNAPLIKQAYVRYHANRRQGSARTKTRSQIAFTSKRMYKQKGTGRARHGDKTAPQLRKGAHAFAKRRTREDFRKDMPKKMRRMANRNALLAKLVDAEVKIIDGLKFAEPKTKLMLGLLEGLKVDASALLALNPDAGKSDNARKSARNVENVTTCRADQLNCFEMLNHRYLVIDKADLEAWLSGPSSKTSKDAKPSSAELNGRVKKSGKGAKSGEAA